MAVEYITASSGQTDAAGDFTITGAAPSAAGNIIILQILQDGTTDSAVTQSSATNITSLSGSANTWTAIGEYQVGNAESGRQYLWVGRSTGTSAPTFSGGNSTSEDVFARMYEFSGVDANATTVAGILENATAGTIGSAYDTSTTVADVSVQTTYAGGMALNFVALSDDSMGLAEFAGESGGDWVLSPDIYESSSGTDGTIAMMRASMASAGTINGGADTITSIGWGVIGFALIPELSPTIALGTNVVDEASITDTTPSFEFTGTDANSDDVTYNIQIDTVNTFDSQTHPNDPIQYYNYTTGGATWNLGNVAGYFLTIGQSFEGKGTLKSAKFYLKAVGTISGTMVAKLYPVTSGTPPSENTDGTVLATSDTYDVGGLTTSYQWITFTFTGGEQYSMTEGTHYVIGVTYNGGSSGNCVGVYGDYTTLSHPGNRVAYAVTPSTWADGDFDVSFYVYTDWVAPFLSHTSNVETTAFVRAGDSDPFTSGQEVTYTVPGGDALTAPDTYYWRVRGKDPAGSNTYGAWSSTRSFTLTSDTGTNMQLNVGDSWKEVTKVQINVGDSWKEVTKVQINVGDTWKSVF